MSSLSGRLLATDFGSPHGVTVNDKYVRSLWHITYYIGVPLAAIVVGLIVWCLIRYRVKPGDEPRRAAQFQYHIPLEAFYTIVPLILVAVVFGFLYGGEDKITHVSSNPYVKIKVEGFQWGWRFTYPNGHQEQGSYNSVTSINDEKDLPVLYMPANETVQLQLLTDDVVHTFYVPEFLFQRDMIAGVNNVVDINVTKTGTFLGECTNLCGTYHAFMRFNVDVMPVNAFNAWMNSQAPGSIHTAGVHQ
ncbi:cytochrome c oxidase subunit II [Acidiferrimicrobium sp. IK]|uniref:cytochrome c oxidase subunit II n=1 Tax=Acidiferrimicrobium sp. IK TaxID=2871700 RepID=UPI0021CB022D|nr:cytochrome c oxidase subunit II [Acidiferrimicrobium sp. IK]MCU4186303.1 cytochrome c oxidase subunit II [Acidiferrimicrobium sp. IK]